MYITIHLGSGKRQTKVNAAHVARASFMRCQLEDSMVVVVQFDYTALI